MRKVIHFTSTLCILFCILLSFECKAESLVWDDVVTQGSYPVTGYIVYYGTASRTYTHSVDVGNVTSVDLSGITVDGDENYYLAVTAYTSIGEEGFLSNEVSIAGDDPDDDPDDGDGGGGGGGNGGCFICIFLH